MTFDEAVDILELNNVSLNEKVVRDARNKLLIKMHPDKNSSPEATDASKKIIFAYEYLKALEFSKANEQKMTRDFHSFGDAQQNPTYLFPLHRAVWDGFVENVKRYLETMDVDTRDQYNHTPLYCALSQPASRNNSKQIAALLIEKGANVLNAEILLLAAKNRHDDVINTIVEKDNGNAFTQDTLVEAFLAAILTGNLKIIKALYEKYRFKFNVTLGVADPASTATTANNPEVTRYLSTLGFYVSRRHQINLRELHVINPALYNEAPPELSVDPVFNKERAEYILLEYKVHLQKDARGFSHFWQPANILESKKAKLNAVNAAINNLKTENYTLSQVINDLKIAGIDVHSKLYQTRNAPLDKVANQKLSSKTDGEKVLDLLIKLEKLPALDHLESTNSNKRYTKLRS